MGSSRGSTKKPYRTVRVPSLLLFPRAGSLSRSLPLGLFSPSVCLSGAHVIGSIRGVPINPRGVPSTDGLWKTSYPPALTLLNRDRLASASSATRAARRLFPTLTNTQTESAFGYRGRAPFSSSRGIIQPSLESDSTTIQPQAEEQR